MDETTSNQGGGDTTPVPPPAPVLPEPGRRFADDEDAASGDDYVPRRSASSVTSPPEQAQRGPDPDPLTPATPTRPDRSDIPGPSEIPDPPGDDDPAPATGWRRWIAGRERLAAIAGAVVVVAIVGGLVLGSLTSHPAATTGPSPSGSSSPNATTLAPGTPDPANLLAAEELSGLGAGITWTIDNTIAAPTATSPRPLCLSPTPTGEDGPTNAQLRILNGRGAATAGLLHVQESYPSAETAQAAYTSRLSQLGGCTGNQAWVTGGFSVSGLGDAAVGVSVDDQDNPLVHHAILMARTGHVINLLDAYQQGAHTFALADVAKAATAALQRQCGLAQGACPGNVRITASVPPVSDVAGWLTPSDLPRITAGAGRWGATDPAAPNLVGSQCEGLDLNEVPSTSSASHRTYLLADDSKAPSGFGVDEAIYTFAKKAAATALTAKVAANITSCPDRTQTATIKTQAPVTAPGATGKKVSVATFTVVQKVSDTKSVMFRVAIGAVGTRVVYLLANPSTGFDFSDAEWSTIAIRAAQRSTQS